MTITLWRQWISIGEIMIFKVYTYYLESSYNPNYFTFNPKIFMRIRYKSDIS